MCEHSISEHLLRSQRFPSAARIDGARASRIYVAHATAVYKVLFHVVGCAKCADHVLAHTILKVSSEGLAPLTRTDVLRSALACACRGSGEQLRIEMEARIRAWLLTGDTMLAA